MLVNYSKSVENAKGVNPTLSLRVIRSATLPDVRIPYLRLRVLEVRMSA